MNDEPKTEIVSMILDVFRKAVLRQAWVDLTDKQAGMQT